MVGEVVFPFRSAFKRDSKVTESLTTSCAYDHFWLGCRLDGATQAHP